MMRAMMPIAETGTDAFRRASSLSRKIIGHRQISRTYQIAYF
jgi:hypothetical protein